MIDLANTFLVTPLPRVRRVLRRRQALAGGWACLPKQRHEATFVLPAGDIAQPLDDHRRILRPVDSAALAGQPLWAELWPTHCANPTCLGWPQGLPGLATPYAFADEDPREVEHERLGRREDTGEVVLAYRPPTGGIVEAWWMRSEGVGADGQSLAVQTPDGLWFLDVEQRGGERFERSGTGSALTVVQTAGPAWRWSLREGVLIDAGGAASPRGV